MSNNISEKDKELNYKKYFEGKQITKQGFGFLGRGANVVKFLLENGANVLVTDMKSEKDLEQSIKELEDFVLEKYKVSIDKFLDKNGNKRVAYILGEHRLQDFEKIKVEKNKNKKEIKYISGCDYVIQASGVSKDNIFLLHAKESGVKVYQESSLFADIIREFNSNLENENKIKIIGITGTRGKTTTTFLIKHTIDKFLEKENIKNNTSKKAYFGGNVQGVATLENLKCIKGGDTLVMELDSWILQGFADIKYSPNIAVFTTFMPDHMNYYKNNMKDYFLDKANIFLNQKREDTFITTESIMISMEKYLNEEMLRSFYDKESKKIYLNELEIQNINTNFNSKLLSEHNKINVALAIKACEAFGVDDVSIQESLDDFTGVPGRLELIKKYKNKVGAEVSIINDTCATTGDASIAALDSFEDKNIILITGGRDKELDMSKYAEKIIEYKNNYKEKKVGIKEIILLNDETTTGTKKLLELFDKCNFETVNYILVSSLEEAVAAARSAAEKSESKNNIILFTPAFASFGMFQNEYDRGDKFVKIVNDLF